MLNPAISMAVGQRYKVTWGKPCDREMWQLAENAPEKWAESIDDRWSGQYHPEVSTA